MSESSESGGVTGRSRRGVLAAGAAAAAAAVGVGMARPPQAEAGTDGDVVLGAYNLAASPTTIDTKNAAIPATLQVWGHDSANTLGCVLDVESFDGDAIGIQVFTSGVALYADGGTGVTAQGGPGNGVEGYCSSATASGVYGENTNGGFGVAGRSNGIGGVAVLGDAQGAGGTAVQAVGNGAGTALDVQGKAHFTRSGVATIAGTTSTPKSSIAITLPFNSGAIAATGGIIATLQTHVSGVFVAAVVPNSARTGATIYLNKAVTQTVKAAWLVVD